MAKYVKKPIVVEAEQWFQNGDLSEDESVLFTDNNGNAFLSEGKIVKFYKHEDDREVCNQCGGLLNIHGWIETLEGGHIVCPGDWIITGVRAEKYPCKPDVFEKTYEPA